VPDECPLGKCGKSSGYADGCRRDACKAYNTGRHRKWRKRQKLDPGSAIHGTENGYNNYGCKCWPCKNAKVAANKRRKRARKERQR
jgi:hypothetical protein